MRSQIQNQLLQGRAQRSGRRNESQVEFRFMRWLVAPLLNSAKALRRRTLVSNLFKHVKEIHGVDHGYDLRFDRPDDWEDLNALLEKIANYIIFESRNAPQFSFAIVEKPRVKTFWLQVRSIAGEVSNTKPASMSRYSSRFHVT